MMIFKKTIPRRTFLKGAGTTLALPLLDAMIPAFARGAETGAKPVVRLSTLFVPNGRIMQKWTPAAEGAGFAMSPTLEPLTPFKDQLLVLSGLNIKAADPVGNEPGGVHARPAAAFLTGIHPKPGGAVGISLDQVAAREFGKETQLASLELGLDSPEIASDDGAYSAYYMNTISWRTGTSPLPMEINPRSVFERMFGDSDTTSAAERMRRVQRQRSILDSVTEGVARLANGVGASDRTKLTEYLDAIRDIERRIRVAETSSEKTASTEQEAYERPVGIPTTFAEHAKLMFDLQVVAFQSDLTRVSTFMLGRDQTDRNYREIGIADGHHPLSHHKEVPETMALVEQIDRYQTTMVAYFLEKLRATADGDGTLLDHSIILFGSSLSDSNYHIHNNIPMVVAGGAGGQLKGGRHIKYAGLPLSNLHLTVLDLLKIQAPDYVDNKFSDATGKLEHLSIA
ncbi:MAG: hypothetical protein HW398_171 [Acidobacteria bacterium]|nr:hypothetical protein [Acidobacteriota bacterium]